MVAPRVELARSHAADLSALVGRVVTVDPAEAAANLPAVLILPPEVTYDRAAGNGASITWRLAVLAEGPAGLAAWTELDELLDELATHAAVTDARPGQYTLSGDKDPLPAYIVTATE